ncbi:MAG: NAD(P)H-binding protein [Melioribacteraceae bacterium]|jgi:nucleoside-diphosphate-sugar epimerase|nr:NAD(P)H-binding protein [Melioribacteraceae bacterium]
MKALVLGGSGATGKLVVQQLVKRNIQVRVVVRESAIIDSKISHDKSIEIIKGNINDFEIAKIKDLVQDCDSVICCFGHNISLKGLFGPPRKLVSNTVGNIIEAIQTLNLNTKFILMSTTAYTNKKIGEVNTFGEKIVFAVLKVLLPPHKDNMLAADHLVYKLDSNSNINWVAVRPDSLIDEDNVSEYEIHNKKIRSPISNPGKTSRINVSHFMVELVTNDKLWQEWKHKTPVIFNKE